ncbi:MAG: AAA family ATPase [Candidatus Micrarchaeota archaeon]|nr:AAA family ATPase [Candidatus Micrarchaeota archaeon]
MSVTLDLSRYTKAPNGTIFVLKPEEANRRLAQKRDALRETIQRENWKYIPKDNELGQIAAARKAGLPIALIGPPGIAKTTLVSVLADQEGVAMIKINGADAGKRLWQVIGAPREIGDVAIYEDGPLSLAARASETSIFYVDEAIEFSALFTSLSSVYDHTHTLPIEVTGEDLNTRHIDLFIVFNPPTIEDRDKLPRPATLDRFVMIRFEGQNGQAAVDTLSQKYGVKQYTQKGPVLSAEMSMEDAIRRYAKPLEIIYNELNSNTVRNHESIVVKPVTPRSLEHVFKLISFGLSPAEAVRIAMVNPMVPVDDSKLLKTFLTAADQVIASNGL